MIKIFFLFLLLIFLLGCKPSEEDIKKFGFENLEEMLRIRGQGFLLRKDFLKSEADKELAKVLGFDNIKEMEINILDGFSNKNEITVSSKQNLFEKTLSDILLEKYNYEEEFKENKNSIKYRISWKLFNENFYLLNSFDKSAFKWKCQIFSIDSENIHCGKYIIKTNSIPVEILIDLKSKQSIRFSGRISLYEENYDVKFDEFIKLFEIGEINLNSFKVYDAKIITLNYLNLNAQLEKNKELSLTKTFDQLKNKKINNNDPVLIVLNEFIYKLSNKVELLQNGINGDPYKILIKNNLTNKIYTLIAVLKKDNNDIRVLIGVEGGDHILGDYKIKLINGVWSIVQECKTDYRPKEPVETCVKYQMSK